MRPRSAALLLGVLILAASCSNAPSPASSAPTSSTAADPVVAAASACGVQQVYWRGQWWVAEGLTPVAGASPQRPAPPQVLGTMTATAPDRARFVSEALIGPVNLTAHPERDPGRPPLGVCIT